MINIITGAVNSRKTTKLIHIFNIIGIGDGFFNRKIYINNHYVGQELVGMQSGIKRLWSNREMQSGEGHEIFCYKKYSFYKEGLEFAENIITSILESGIEPIFIDEIGPLELQEKGFHKLFYTWRLCFDKRRYI